ncbi:hypothetical protein QNA24_30260 [Rhodococcus qingshengii]|uniref:hypothetical protein n=1 Tax=Rhodococcus TaxID=1827 RepID=UPI001E3FB884|nr:MULTISPECIES: hypothetical protein [Rhodococcus]MCD2099534.1 hypothetical protein [Rhodococcus rhodochrous]MCD2123902.1 hypothetical protein [Rhodococcus rhodochrous]MCQ4136671.1 hypothetical protein [Rhodococcus rhodochrous]MDJ0490668.1 hypothetical protein [Rhodococcus qingshengii]
MSVETLVSPDGVEVLVGSPTEREQLLALGYKKPAVAPKVAAPAETVEVDDKPARRTSK